MMKSLPLLNTSAENSTSWTVKPTNPMIMTIDKMAMMAFMPLKSPDFATRSSGGT